MSETSPRTEHEQNRPYRRAVALLFTASLVGICGLVLRGIIAQLDRMPAIERPGTVDTRALRACADDLLRLEESARKLAGRTYSEAGDMAEAADSWVNKISALETERASIVGRCALDRATDDVAVRELERAAGHVEDLMRSYRLTLSRHFEDGRGSSREARKAVERARASLSAR
ncbi:MAG: hypothetical protein HY791_01395 [Deltaproteobacteria bacterium]|nr:hypothetical protein [Deltaproteobacteria bacterium]